jgi:hypothetical protein
LYQLLQRVENYLKGFVTVFFHRRIEALARTPCVYE